MTVCCMTVHYKLGCFGGGGGGGGGGESKMKVS